MKYFRLADKAYRETVDLRLYEDDITAAVAKVKPDAQLFVECDGFYTIPELGKCESILVSQELRKNSGLNEYTMQRPCLFNSTQHHYLPISKKAIRKMLKKNLDIAKTGKKLLVEKTQLEAFLRNEI